MTEGQRKSKVDREGEEGRERDRRREIEERIVNTKVIKIGGFRSIVITAHRRYLLMQRHC